MAESQEKHLFSYQEVAEALVKKQGLHEGRWALYFEFGISAANFNTKEGGQELVPAAIVPLQSIGLLRAKDENNLTVDAAVVNPKGKDAATTEEGRAAPKTKRKEGKSK